MIVILKSKVPPLMRCLKIFKTDFYAVVTVFSDRIIDTILFKYLDFFLIDEKPVFIFHLFS